MSSVPACQILRPLLLVGVASLVSVGAQAQTADNAGAGEIVVTGSRIVANGYQAPTPVTVVSTTELLERKPESLAASLSSLPQFVGTSGANVTSSQAGSPSAGNYLNLRRLGAIETLLLLDGQRLPPTSFDGTTDANIIPQSLIQRVDVVTGGASAAYGSDAVAGVVNFILDTEFTGVKFSAQAGIASRGDNPQQKVGVAVGKYLLDNRLHFEASFDYFYQPGIPNNGERPYGGNYEGGWVNVGADPSRPCSAGTCADNPYTPVFNVRLGHATDGTLIGAGRTAAQAEARVGSTPFSLTGYTFEPTLLGGPVSADGIHPADLGQVTGTPNFNVGGADTSVSFGTTLTSKLRTKQAFGRLDYDFGGSVTGFVQGSWSDADTRYVTVGAGTQFNSFQIYADNAFLPQVVRDAMAAEGIASFVGSRVEADQHPKEALTNNKALTILGGLKGMLGSFNWSANFSHGESTLKTRHYGNFNQQRWFPALDAVDEGEFNTGVANGHIVCRMDLTNPGVVPGCLPWNPFGNGSPSAESYSWIQDEPSQYQVKQRQSAVSANLSGPLFELPAGMVNFAIGGEYRQQKINQTSNVDPSQPIPLYEPGLSESDKTDPANLNGIPEGLRAAANPFNLIWNSTNVGNAYGKQNIKEAYTEIDVPLLSDVPFFQHLSANLAARYVDYSVSGNIWAWKVGGSWAPIDDLRFRGTLSRDIRAPTLYELFQGTGSTRGIFNDIHTDGSDNVITLNRGNPDLKPEKARTITIGGIWQPSFFPGFSASVDYYKIRIRDQITRPGTSLLNQLCEDSRGTGPTCQYINRPFPWSETDDVRNFPLTLTTVPFNQAYSIQEGLDYEVNYRTDLGAGRLDLRLLGNYTWKYEQASSPGALPQDLAGADAGVPKFRATAQANYRVGRVNLGTNVRYLGAIYYTKQPNVFVANNRVAPVAYVNLNASVDIRDGDNPITLYANVSNLFDKFVFMPRNNAQPTEFYPSSQAHYDVIGRYFVIGVRGRF